jgi:hypothetical protein
MDGPAVRARKDEAKQVRADAVPKDHDAQWVYLFASVIFGYFESDCCTRLVAAP